MQVAESLPHESPKTITGSLLAGRNSVYIIISTKDVTNP